MFLLENLHTKKVIIDQIEIQTFIKFLKNVYTYIR